MALRIGILTVSDRGARGEREDASGQRIRELLAPLTSEVVHYEIVPDERHLIAGRLRRWCDSGAVDLVLTTGGTGLGPRDVTPEATLSVVDKQVPGLAEAMRAAGLRSTPMAMLSRAVAGVRRRCLVINLPGSPAAVAESLQALLPVLPHAVALLREEVDEHEAPKGGETAAG